MLKLSVILVLWFKYVSISCHAYLYSTSSVERHPSSSLPQPDRALANITLQVFGPNDAKSCAADKDLTVRWKQLFNIYINYWPVYGPRCDLRRISLESPFSENKHYYGYAAKYAATANMIGRQTYSCKFFTTACEYYVPDYSYCEYDDDGSISRDYGVQCYFTITVEEDFTWNSGLAPLVPARRRHYHSTPINSTSITTTAHRGEQRQSSRYAVWVWACVGAVVGAVVLGVVCLLLVWRRCHRGPPKQWPNIPVQYNIYSSDITAPDPIYTEIAHTQTPHSHMHAHYANTHSIHNDYVNTHTTTQPSNSNQEPAYCEVRS